MTNEAQIIKQHMAKLGSEGGKSKSGRKVEAVTANLEKARAMRAFYRQHPELRAAMRLQLNVSQEAQDDIEYSTEHEVEAAPEGDEIQTREDNL